MADEVAHGALHGIRVLEFSQIVAGPVCGINLSDLGAEVIKVEPLEGEQTRRSGAIVPLNGKGFQALNRGKSSLSLDLSDERARDVIHRLMPGIDVVTINYRLGVAERLGVDYATLSAIRPDLIYWQNTGFGKEGPEAYRAGSDIVAQGYSGLIVADGKTDEDGAPVQVTMPIADQATGIAAAMGICAALFHRERSGEGQLIDTSLLRTGLFLQAASVMREPVHDTVTRDPLMVEIAEVRARGGSYDAILAVRHQLRRLRAAFRLYYGGYRTRDGAVVLGALTKANRDGMRAVLGIEGERSDEPDYDARDPENLAASERWLKVIRKQMLTRTAVEWVAEFDAAGVPATVVQLPEEMADDPQVQADGMMWELEHAVTGPQRVVGPLLTMSATPTAASGPAPDLGSDNDALLAEAGLSEAEIAALRDAGVVR
ncbi:MAG: CoA transferase [Dehalococcoidia bacterium]